MKTDDLIDRLASDTEVRPLPAPGTRTALWLVLGALYLVVVAVMTRRLMPGDVSVTPLYVFQQAAVLVTGIAAARAAFSSVIPGATSRVQLLAIASAAAWVISLLAQSMIDVRRTGAWGVTVETDWPCVASIAFGALVLGGPLVRMLRHGAPLTPRVTAVLAGVAGLSFANVEACLTRPHAFAMTILLWHGGTIVLAALVFATMGRRWLRWPVATTPENGRRAQVQ